jgi:LuxR family maltose regulon positive regulatory protein
MEPPGHVLLDVSMTAPRLRRQLVARPRLVEKLCRDPDAPLALVVAPAGYGKTVLLSEWASKDERPFAWLSLDEAANEPDVLRALIGEALASLDVERPFVVVLDDAQHLVAPQAYGVLTGMAPRLAPGCVLAIASRREPAMPIGRLRAHRLVVEIGPRDLAMTHAEASALLSAAGVQVSRDATDRLIERTEGWPAGL